MIQATATISVRVAAIVPEAEGIRTLELVDVDGRKLPGFSPGAHIDVHLGNGLVRQYSLCNDPSERHRYLIGVLLDESGRGGSRAIHQLKVGDLLDISAPRNHFELVHGSRGSLLLAGGIGITPILCMAEHLAASGSEFSMHYAARSIRRAAFVERIAASAFAGRVMFHWDDGPVEQILDLEKILSSPAQGVHIYVCGPRGFMEAVLGTAAKSGWPADRVHYEFFSGEVVHSPGDISFTLKIASSGKSVIVGPEQTVVEALAAAGIDIPTSCEQGVCGTCLTRIIQGQPDHRDMFLTEAEQERNDCFLPCCSRSKSRMMVLDL